MMSSQTQYSHSLLRLRHLHGAIVDARLWRCDMWVLASLIDYKIRGSRHDLESIRAFGNGHCNSRDWRFGKCECSVASQVRLNCLNVNSSAPLRCTTCVTAYLSMGSAGWAAKFVILQIRNMSPVAVMYASKLFFCVDEDAYQYSYLQ